MVWWCGGVVVWWWCGGDIASSLVVVFLGVGGWCYVLFLTYCFYFWGWQLRSKVLEGRQFCKLMFFFFFFLIFFIFGLVWFGLFDFV